MVDVDVVRVFSDQLGKYRVNFLSCFFVVSERVCRIIFSLDFVHFFIVKWTS